MACYNPNIRAKGFTLIELLVVIAIIGILSSVILASLNSARSKGNNAAIKSNLASMRPQMEVYFDDPTLGNGTYGASGTNGINCIGANPATIFGNTKVQKFLIAAQVAGNGLARCVAQPLSSASSYVVSVQLSVPESGNNYWCVDSTGNSRGHVTPVSMSSNASVCP